MAALALQDFRSHLDGVVAAVPIAPVLVAADDVAGDEFDRADEHTYLAVRNPTGGAIDVTFTITSECDFGVSHALTVTVAPAADPAQPAQLVGPFNRSRFAASAPIVLAYSGPGLEVGAVRL
ncbi:MAG: hypothetical protein KC560_12225 [Myxococcales bacterium]|nr:hypothetical protein [Myxococcales bacterium]